MHKGDKGDFLRNRAELVQFPMGVHNKHAQVVHKGMDTEYSHLVVHNIHTLGGAHDNLSCSLSITT